MSDLLPLAQSFLAAFPALGAVTTPAELARLLPTAATVLQAVLADTQTPRLPEPPTQPPIQHPYGHV